MGGMEPGQSSPKPAQPSAPASANGAGRSLYDLLNSPFLIWFLSTFVLSVLSFYFAERSKCVEAAGTTLEKLQRTLDEYYGRRYGFIEDVNQWASQREPRPDIKTVVEQWWLPEKHFSSADFRSRGIYDLELEYLWLRAKTMIEKSAFNDAELTSRMTGHTAAEYINFAGFFRQDSPTTAEGYANEIRPLVQNGSWQATESDQIRTLQVERTLFNSRHVHSACGPAHLFKREFDSSSDALLIVE